MPIDRCDISFRSTLQGMVSKKDDYVAAVVWNTGDVRQGASIKLENIPFDNAVMEIYHIDKAHNSYYETKNDDLTPDSVSNVTIEDGSLTVNSIVENRGVMFVRLMADAEAEALPQNDFAKVKAVKKYREHHTVTSSYSIFDAKTWTARLSSNGLNTGRTMIGVVADELPDNMEVTVKTSDEISNTNKSAVIALRIDYQSASGKYTKSVLIHGEIYHEGTAPNPLWGTEADPDEIIAVEDFHNFKYSIKQNAPDDFSGKAIITFIQSRTGMHSKSIFQLKKTDENDGIKSINAGAGNSVDGNSPVYNLQGQRVTNPGRGIYIQKGKKYIKK